MVYALLSFPEGKILNGDAKVNEKTKEVKRGEDVISIKGLNPEIIIIIKLRQASN